ncbi:MAG: peptidase T [Deltaproteobacteria bacterium]|nr:peptidase T [Deltaproteobacteria bacterium]
MTFYMDPHILEDETSAVARLLRYVSIETTSNPQNSASPSSDGQRTFGELLVTELQTLGLKDAKIDANGYVTASRHGAGTATIGLIAHMDTSDAFSGKNVQPVVHRNYSGETIQLKNEVTISPDDDKWLNQCLGHTIITADGTTLLGADDKAGVAIIMGVLEFLQKHPDVTHPTLRICFTPDEEIGRGTAHFPTSDFGADFAITVDGTFVGELNFETFEAHSMDVTFEGVSVHPGYAKGVMVNALRHMGAFLEKLPKAQSPEQTADREGFIHPVSVTGDAARCSVHLIIRDFTEAGAKSLCATVDQLVQCAGDAEPGLKVTSHTEFNYPNMMKYMEAHQVLVTNLEVAVQKAGISPSIVPIRGGTDGANLCRKGLLTPNLFTGAVNLHGPKEWVSVTNMGYSFCAILNLLRLYAGETPHGSIDD